MSWAFQKFDILLLFSLGEAKSYTNDILFINNACIARLLHCASDVNVNFLGVLDHMTADLLQRFTSKRLPHMLVSVCNQYQ